MPRLRRCYELTNLRIHLPSGVAPGRTQGRGDGLAPLLTGKATTLEQVSGVLLLLDQGGDVPERRPWAFNAKIAVGAPYSSGSNTPDIAELANSLTHAPENKVKISRRKIVTRYS